jgi:hypothetical protein
MSQQNIQVGVDSQCLSYVIDAFSGISAPTDSLYKQKLALIRLFFYCPGTLWVTSTVTTECSRIRNICRAELHASFIGVLFGEIPLNDSSDIIQRAEMLKIHHSGENDCIIVAEAENVGHTTLLSFDRRLVRHLTPYTKVRLIDPAKYWDELSIPHGIKADKIPHITNPLSSENWWHW